MVQNLKPQHFHRDKLQQLTTNEHSVLEEMNQSWGMLAWGHGTTKSCPPGLCCDMAGQSGRIPFVCVPTCVCVHVRVCLDLCFPVKECALACDCACVYQQECFSCQSEGQLVIWSAASPVVVTAADCHEKRGDGKERGEGLWGWTLWYNLVIQVWGKHNGHQKNVPSLWTTKPTIQKGTLRYEWIWKQSKTVINKTFSTILIVLFLKASVPFCAQSLMSCLKWLKLTSVLTLSGLVWKAVCDIQCKTRSNEWYREEKRHWQQDKLLLSMARCINSLQEVKGHFNTNQFSEIRKVVGVRRSGSREIRRPSWGEERPRSIVEQIEMGQGMKRH